MTTDPTYADLRDQVTALTRIPGMLWSVSLRDGAGNEVAELDGTRVLSTASIGKILLLLEVARQFDAGTLAPRDRLARTGSVADSGLWQHLRSEELYAEDAAVLVASVSDNLATNVLLDQVGLAHVHRLGEQLGLEYTRLLDRVRDERLPTDPPRLSEGCATELSGVMSRLAAGELVTPEVSTRVEGWLATGTDLSMVASAFGLDPLAHVEPDRGLVLRHKTGADDGVRADAGFVRGAATLSYAVIANWEPGGGDRRDEVLAGMRAIGEAVVQVVGRGG